MQVGDQAEHLRDVLAVHGHVVFDDADFQAPAAASAGEVAAVAAVGQEPAGAGQGEVALDADQDVGAGGQHPGDPVSAGEIAVQDPDPVAGEYFRVPGDHGVQQRLLALGLGAAGRAGDHRQRGAGGGVAGQQVTDLRVGAGVISGAGRAERLPVGRRVGDPRHGPVDRAQAQLADVDGPVVVVAVLAAGGGQQPGLQPGQRGGAQGCPPGAQHLRGGHPERPLPGDEHQVTEDRGQHPGIVRVRHQRHQDRRADRRRGRHRPPGLAFHLPFQCRLRGDLIDHPGTGQLIELLFEGAQPGVISRMPACLHLAVPADHRRRDRGHLHEHQLLPGPDPRGAGHHQRGAAGLRRRAGRRDQVRQPDRDHRATQLSRITLTCWNGIQRRGTVELHPGLLCEDWRQIPRLLQESRPYHP